MGVHGILATKVLSVAGAGTGLIWTQEAMYTPEMAIPVSLDLLWVRVPVQTGPHSAEECFTMEFGNCRGCFVGVRSHGPILRAESEIGWIDVQEKKPVVQRLQITTRTLGTNGSHQPVAAVSTQEK